jgi:hypothetical protein
MSRGQQLARDGAPDEAADARNQDTHYDLEKHTQ